jgi:hypothetical protein
MVSWIVRGTRLVSRLTGNLTHQSIEHERADMRRDQAQQSVASPSMQQFERNALIRCQVQQGRQRRQPQHHDVITPRPGRQDAQQRLNDEQNHQRGVNNTRRQDLPDRPIEPGLGRTHTKTDQQARDDQQPDRRAATSVQSKHDLGEFG